MRVLPVMTLLCGFLGLLSPGSNTCAAAFIDSAGRSVQLPGSAERIFAAGPPAAIYLYVLKPQALLGWPRELRPEERHYIAPAFRDLPTTGRLTGRGNESNLERVLALKPDLIVDVGSLTPTYVDLADRIQAQTGIPYVLIDGRLDSSAQALRLLGRAIGAGSRAEAIARDAEQTLAEAARVRAAVPRERWPRVYLARTADGLETGLRGSINSELIERAGGINVMTSQDGRHGLVRVSMENLYLANPDTIITWDPAFHAAVWRDPRWQSVDAVARKRVHLSPLLPFGWIDRPPSLNRLIGLRWLLGLFHPDAANIDLRREVRRFYRLYYQVDLDDAALSALLQPAPR